MVMSRDPGFNFFLILFPNFVLNFGKVTKFGGNWPKKKRVTSKKELGGGGGGGNTPQCL